MTVGRRHLSLRDAVVDELRELIINQVLQPGQRIVERQLSEQFEVSRIPLREALLQLETEGLVTVLPRRGTFVATFSLKDLSDFFDIRESLEPLAARLAAERCTQADLARLRAHLSEAETAVASGVHDAIARGNVAFHDEIVETAANGFLSTLMRPLNIRLRWQFRLAQDLDLGLMCREHEDLFQAIAAHDTARAAILAFQHAAANRTAAMASFRDKGWAAEPAPLDTRRDRQSGRGAPR
jgi:DNA-binding GntR family transcriptional regulator